MSMLRALPVAFAAAACAGAPARTETSTVPGAATAFGAPAAPQQSTQIGPHAGDAGTEHAPAATAAGSIAFMKDDVDGAFARARTEKKAVFVDAWAEWCHTCLSMQHFVFVEPSLKALENRIVFLAL